MRSGQPSFAGDLEMQGSGWLHGGWNGDKGGGQREAFWGRTRSMLRRGMLLVCIELLDTDLALALLLQPETWCKSEPTLTA